jgi:YHS domain-containing protein
MRINLRIICIAVASILLVAVGKAQAGSINTNKDGVAIKGYDTVAYFTINKPVSGKNEFQFKWKNAKWYFANANHLELFKANPEKYAPQYGGY